MQQIVQRCAIEVVAFSGDEAIDQLERVGVFFQNPRRTVALRCAPKHRSPKFSQIVMRWYGNDQMASGPEHTRALGWITASVE